MERRGFDWGSDQVPHRSRCEQAYRIRRLQRMGSLVRPGLHQGVRALALLVPPLLVTDLVAGGDAFPARRISVQIMN
jgi:hypothetical protein